MTISIGSQLTTDGNDMIRSLPDEGIMLPINAHTKNNNNNDNDVTTTAPLIVS